MSRFKVLLELLSPYFSEQETFCSFCLVSREFARIARYHLKFENIHFELNLNVLYRYEQLFRDQSGNMDPVLTNLSFPFCVHLKITSDHLKLSKLDETSLNSVVRFEDEGIYSDRIGYCGTFRNQQYFNARVYNRKECILKIFPSLKTICTEILPEEVNLDHFFATVKFLKPPIRSLFQHRYMGQFGVCEKSNDNLRVLNLTRTEVFMSSAFFPNLEFLRLCDCRVRWKNPLNFARLNELIYIAVDPGNEMTLSKYEKFISKEKVYKGLGALLGRGALERLDLRFIPGLCGGKVLEKAIDDNPSFTQRLKSVKFELFNVNHTIDEKGEMRFINFFRKNSLENVTTLELVGSHGQFMPERWLPLPLLRKLSVVGCTNVASYLLGTTTEEEKRKLRSPFLEEVSVVGQNISEYLQEKYEYDPSQLNEVVVSPSKHSSSYQKDVPATLVSIEKSFFEHSRFLRNIVKEERETDSSFRLFSPFSESFSDVPLPPLKRVELKNMSVRKLFLVSLRKIPTLEDLSFVRVNILSSSEGEKSRLTTISPSGVRKLKVVVGAEQEGFRHVNIVVDTFRHKLETLEIRNLRFLLSEVYAKKGRQHAKVSNYLRWRSLPFLKNLEVQNCGGMMMLDIVIRRKSVYKQYFDHMMKKKEKEKGKNRFYYLTKCKLDMILSEQSSIFEKGQSIHFTPFCCLVGENGSGKSTLLQSLYSSRKLSEFIGTPDLSEYFEQKRDVLGTFQSSPVSSSSSSSSSSTTRTTTTSGGNNQSSPHFISSPSGGDSGVFLRLPSYRVSNSPGSPKPVSGHDHFLTKGWVVVTKIPPSEMSFVEWKREDEEEEEEEEEEYGRRKRIHLKASRKRDVKRYEWRVNEEDQSSSSIHKINEFSGNKRRRRKDDPLTKKYNVRVIEPNDMHEPPRIILLPLSSVSLRSFYTNHQGMLRNLGSMIFDLSNRDELKTLFLLHEFKRWIVKFFSSFVKDVNISEPSIDNSDGDETTTRMGKIMSTKNRKKNKKKRKKKIFNVFLKSEDGRKKRFEHLSDGQKAIVVYVLVLCRMALESPTKKDVVKLVMMDEVDSHLHPSLMAQFHSFLRNFSNEHRIQVICSSHNDTFVSNFRYEDIFQMVVERHGEKEKNKTKTKGGPPPRRSTRVLPMSTQASLFDLFQTLGYSIYHKLKTLHGLNKVFLNKKMVVVEGGTDVMFMDILFRFISKHWPNSAVDGRYKIFEQLHHDMQDTLFPYGTEPHYDGVRDMFFRMKKILREKRVIMSSSKKTRQGSKEKPLDSDLVVSESGYGLSPPPPKKDPSNNDNNKKKKKGSTVKHDEDVVRMLVVADEDIHTRNDMLRERALFSQMSDQGVSYLRLGYREIENYVLVLFFRVFCCSEFNDEDGSMKISEVLKEMVMKKMEEEKKETMNNEEEEEDQKGRRKRKKKKKRGPGRKKSLLEKSSDVIIDVISQFNDVFVIPKCYERSDLLFGLLRSEERILQFLKEKRIEHESPITADDIDEQILAFVDAKKIIRKNLGRDIKNAMTLIFGHQKFITNWESENYFPNELKRVCHKVKEFFYPPVSIYWKNRNSKDERIGHGFFVREDKERSEVHIFVEKCPIRGELKICDEKKKPMYIRRPQQQEKEKKKEEEEEKVVLLRNICGYQAIPLFRALVGVQGDRKPKMIKIPRDSFQKCLKGKYGYLRFENLEEEDEEEENNNQKKKEKVFVSRGRNGADGVFMTFENQNHGLTVRIRRIVKKDGMEMIVSFYGENLSELELGRMERKKCHDGREAVVLEEVIIRRKNWLEYLQKEEEEEAKGGEEDEGEEGEEEEGEEEEEEVVELFSSIVKEVKIQVDILPRDDGWVFKETFSRVIEKKGADVGGMISALEICISFSKE